MASLNISPVKEMHMKASVLAVLLFVATPAMADEASLKKNNCMACHATDKKLVGPSYKDVANKYRGQSDAADKLAKKIRAGGSGVWGPIPMPPHTQVSETEANKLADYILNIK
jgi:cytochrome c